MDLSGTKYYLRSYHKHHPISSSQWLSLYINLQHSVHGSGEETKAQTVWGACSRMSNMEERVGTEAPLFTSQIQGSLQCPLSSSPKVHSIHKNDFPAELWCLCHSFLAVIYCSVAHRRRNEFGNMQSPPSSIWQPSSSPSGSTVTKQHCSFLERKEKTLNPFPLLLSSSQLLNIHLTHYFC